MNKNNQNKEIKVSTQNLSFGKMTARFSNKEKPKNIKETLLRLMNQSKSEKVIFSVVIVLVTIMSVLNLYAPKLIGSVIDNLNEGVIWSLYRSKLMALVSIYIGVSFLTWLIEYLVVGASNRIIKQLREELFFKLSKLPISFFDTKSHGDIMSRFTNDIDQVSSAFSQSTTTLIRSVITVVGSLIMMLVLNVYLTLGVLISVPLIFGLSKLIAKKTINFYKMQQAFTGEINGKVEETVYGLPILQTYNQQDHFETNFNTANQELYYHGRKAQLWTGLLMPLLNVINNLTFAVIGLIGGYLVIEDMITVGIIASFIVYSRQFIRPLNEMASIYNDLMSAIAGAERVFQVLDEVEEVEDEQSITNFTIDGKVDFNNVSFSYTEDIPIIKNLSFSVSSGMKVAIVGPTGSGKTTLVNLLTRFYSPDSGEICIDNKPIELLNRHSLRSNIGFVLQDTYLFSGTIYDNILYGKLDARKEDIIRVARIARAHDFINKLPHKYNTKLTYGGMNLSQGERQLITIARAILLNPRILILDEATSSVDIITEKLISSSMFELMKERTSFIIAHRLSTIVSADLILVLDDGEVIEYGTHETLMKQGGFYQEMYDIQREIAPL